MPNPINAFDDGLTHSVFTYTTDANNPFKCSIRACYIDDGVVQGPALAARTPTNKPKRLKMRHLILTSVDLNNGKALIRRVPCNITDIENYFGTGKTIPAQKTVDGEAFLVTGFVGETWHG